MKPIHSSGCCSTDSEAMNMVSVVYHLITGWKEPESPFNLSYIRLYIPA